MIKFNSQIFLNRYLLRAKINGWAIILFDMDLKKLSKLVLDGIVNHNLRPILPRRWRWTHSSIHRTCFIRFTWFWFLFYFLRSLGMQALVWCIIWIMNWLLWIQWPWWFVCIDCFWRFQYAEFLVLIVSCFEWAVCMRHLFFLLQAKGLLVL